MSKSHKILFQLTGSIACFKACELISQLVKAGYEVQTVATASALKFVGTSTLEGLTGKPVLTDIFAEGHALAHINAAREASLHLICPASANTINKLAHGIADNVIGNLFLANNFQQPVWLVPAMNTQMLEHPATQQSLATLKNWGVRVFASNEGKLACGEIGAGRMLEVEQLFAEVKNFFQTSTEKIGKKVLITSGGTFEAIDAVRGLSNMSSGRTGSMIAETFQQCGWDVTLLHAENSIRPQTPIGALLSFRSADDLEKQLQHTLREENFSAIIHLAAVADFKVTQPAIQKLSSQNTLQLTLVPREKILPRLKSFVASEQKPLIIGFKLTSNASAEERLQRVASLFEDGKVDMIVHNDLSEMDHTKNLHIARIYRRNGLLQEVSTTKDLAKNLEQELRKTL